MDHQGNLSLLLTLSVDPLDEELLYVINFLTTPVRKAIAPLPSCIFPQVWWYRVLLGNTNQNLKAPPQFFFTSFLLFYSFIELSQKTIGKSPKSQIITPFNLL